jgi:hypothetical protein
LFRGGRPQFGPVPAVWSTCRGGQSGRADRRPALVDPVLFEQCHGLVENAVGILRVLERRVVVDQLLVQAVQRLCIVGFDSRNGLYPQ